MKEEFQLPTSASRSVLVIHADSLFGSAACIAFARKGSRILIHHERELEAACRAAAQVAAREAIALPLQMDLSAGERAMKSLIERVVEDFGRLDVVLFFLDADPDGESFERASACAHAALPSLRQSRPAGHFVLIGSCRANEAQLKEWTASLAETYAAQRTRACVNSIQVSGWGQEEEYAPLADDVARFAERLTTQRGVSGRMFCIPDRPAISA